MVPNRNQLISAYALSAVAVLVAVLGSFMYAETASVRLTVPPQKLVANLTLRGSQASGDLKTQHIEATVTQAMDGTATTVLVAPTFAAGEVVFTCTTQCPATLTVPSGTLLATVRLLGYATQSDAVVTPTRPARVSVRATSAGVAWNTAPNTITVIDGGGQYPNGLHVTNPAAITGGADARSAPVIQQSDWDAARTMLTARVTAALDVALKAKAVQMSYIPNGPPTLTVFSAHKVGDMVPSFTMTITGTIAATAFSDTDAQALLRSALEVKVPPDQQLTRDSIQITWQILQTGANGDITVYGTALGFVTPKLSTDTLRARIRGLSPSDARKSLERAVPGSTVEIRISPVAVPWLPLFAQHIAMTVVVQPIGL